MSKWEKREYVRINEETKTKTETEMASDTASDTASVTEDAPASSHRRRFLPAFVGFVTILFALFGVVSLVILAVIGNNHRHEQMLDDVAWAVTPLATFSPEAFDSVADSDQDALLLSAIYRVTLEEQIRQMQETAADRAYELDDLGRMLVPIANVEAAYASLYGDDAVPYHHTIGEEGLSYTYSYDKENGVYHIPQDAGNTMYHLVYDRIRDGFGKVKVHVGYVAGTLAIDERGQEIQPTLDEAQFVQEFTLKTKDNGQYYIVSVKDVRTK